MDKSYRLFGVMIGIAVLPIIINFIARIPFPSGTDVVTEESADFSVTMTVFAIGTPFRDIVTEKTPCFCGTTLERRQR